MKNILWVIFFLCPLNAMAAEMTVCDRGCDYKTIQAAIDSLANHHANTITVQAPYTKNETFLINKSGSGVGSELVIQAKTGETVTVKEADFANGVSYVKIVGLKFVITGRGQSAVYAEFNLIHHITLDGITVVGYPSTSGQQAIRIRNINSHDITIKNSDFSNHGRAMIMCMATQVLIDQNKVHDTWHDFIQGWGHDWVISNNESYNTSQDLDRDHLDLIQTFWINDGRPENQAYNFVVEGNYLHDGIMHLANISGDGNPNFHSWTFRNNILIATGPIAGPGGTTTVVQQSIMLPKTYWYNNLFYGVNGPGGNGNNLALRFFCDGGSSYYHCGADAVVKNNLFIGNGTAAAKGGFYLQESSGLTADYNYVAGPGPGFSAKRDFTEAHGINGGDPKFVNLKGLDFHLQASSPAANRGADLSSTGFAYDKDGVSRPQGGKWDLGPYESKDLPDLRPPQPPTNK